MLAIIRVNPLRRLGANHAHRLRVAVGGVMVAARRRSDHAAMKRALSRSPQPAA
jgi:hypothetical protein